MKRSHNNHLDAGQYSIQGVLWTWQKPEQFARERDEDAIQRWREKDWPRIKASSDEFVDEFPLWECSHVVMEGRFAGFLGVEAVRVTSDQFSFVVETLHDTGGVGPGHFMCEPAITWRRVS